MLAFVLLNTIPDQMEWVLQKIQEIPGVKEAHMLYGIYDIVVIVETETTDKLKELVLNIRKVKHVCTTLTMTIIDS